MTRNEIYLEILTLQDKKFKAIVDQDYVLSTQLRDKEKILQDEYLNMEYVLCAAINYPDEPTPVHTVRNDIKGLVLCGHRHPHIIGQYFALTGKGTHGNGITGFLTSKNRFIERHVAYLIALSAGQCLEQTTRDYKLFSEDIY